MDLNTSRFAVPIFTIIICICFNSSYSKTQSANEIRLDLLNKYGLKNVPPMSDGKDVIWIKLISYLRSVIDFDEVNGILKSSVFFQIQWLDYRLKWDIAATNVRRFTVSTNDVWTPAIIIENSVEDPYLFDPSRAIPLEVGFDGWVYMMFYGVVVSKCYPNVKFYPFDIHQCNITITSYESFLKEVNFSLVERLPELKIVKHNSQWNVSEGQPSITYFGGGIELVNFPIQLERRSTFTVVTVIIPILILCLVNVFVFVIPSGSGERTSFAITVLLAFSVYMSIVSAEVPESDPLPLYNLFLVFKLTYSATITLCSILTVYIHEKEDDVVFPSAIKSVIISLNRFPLCCLGKKEDPGRIQSVDKNKENENDKQANSTRTVNNNIGHSNLEIDTTGPENVIPTHYIGHDKEITWKSVSYAMDKTLFMIFMSIIVLEIVLSFIFTVNKSYVNK